jgi:hypothetical protein
MLLFSDLIFQQNLSFTCSYPAYLEASIVSGTSEIILIIVRWMTNAPLHPLHQILELHMGERLWLVCKAV